MKKVTTFLLLNWNSKMLLLEAFFYLGWARILKSMSFSRVSDSLGKKMEENHIHFKSSKYEDFETYIRSYSYYEPLHFLGKSMFSEVNCWTKNVKVASN